VGDAARADSVETSVHETVYHWHKGMLADAGHDQLVARAREKYHRRT